MAHLWIEDSVTSGGEAAWMVRPLDGESAVPLSASGSAAGAAARAAALLLCSRSAAGEAWLIMSAAVSGVALNGAPLRVGVRVLADRDEIRVAGFGRAFFSTERLATVEVFAGSGKRIDCARCKQAVTAGMHVVVCPRCSRIFHQEDSLGLLCWGYRGRCLCPQPTALDVGFQWTPLGL